MSKTQVNPLAVTPRSGSDGSSVSDRHPAVSGPADRYLVAKLLEATSGAPLRVRLWDGEEAGAEAGEGSVLLEIRDRWALWRLVTDPEYQFGELYSAGRVRVQGDLVTLLVEVYRSRRRRGESLLSRLRKGMSLRRPGGGVSAARRNIHHHYDLGNEFYEKWLDEAAMQYTCAYYPSDDLSLEEAQVAKMEHVARKLELRPGQEVVEAGSGWGGFACFLARKYGVRVRAFNTAREQVLYSRQRALREGLADRVSFFEEDYRRIEGECDVFVSVGMLEHVGPSHYRELGAVIDRTLRPSGRGLIHTIGRNRETRLNRWIDKRIFPGAHPPTLREMSGIFEPFDFSILDVENLRLHYDRTLVEWLERFERHRDWVEERYGREFARAWRLYLAGSIAAFRAGKLQLFQVVFARGEENGLPLSRAHLYEGDSGGSSQLSAD